ncbi:MAG TPA: hypothetical protein VF384_18630 [Planctomycetota bacterium]
MVDEHPLIDHAVGRAWSWVICAFLLSAWASCGYPTGRRIGRHWRHTHGPLEFDQYRTIDVLGVAIGLGVLAFWIPRLASKWSLQRRVRRTQDARFLARAGAPQTIYELLLAVAVRDGHAGQDEIAVVRRLLMRELPQRILPRDLDSWAASLRRPRDPVLVARSLALLLTPDERRMVLRWCREVAEVDPDRDTDADLLQRLTKVLGRKLVTSDTTGQDSLP